MPSDAMLSKPDTTSIGAQTRQAFTLLRRAARPDQHHLGWAVLWLMLAALFEVLAPSWARR